MMDDVTCNFEATINPFVLVFFLAFENLQYLKLNVLQEEHKKQTLN
jgi:hypothetical protein